MRDPEIIMAQVTDVYGRVESESLVVRVEAGWASLECDGVQMVVPADELRAALEPRREVRAA